MKLADIQLPPDYPKPPSAWESTMAAVLLTRGKLKAGSIWFGDNSKKLFLFISDRAIAEKILELVPSIPLPVYERITPPLTDFPLTMMLPMPDSEPRLPARVTAFTSAPWGRVGLFLVVFDDPEYRPRWGMWRLRQPSAKTGTRFPFFRLGDFDDAQLLTWLVFKPFIEAQGMVIDDLDLPATDQYLGPWHKVRSILRFKEEPEWFQKVLNGDMNNENTP